MGVVGVGVKMRELQQILASFELDFDLTAFLVNREGVVQVHTSDAMITNATIDDLLPVSEYRKKIFTKSRVESSWYKYNGRKPASSPVTSDRSRLVSHRGKRYRHH